MSVIAIPTSLSKLAKLGFIAKAVVYATIGVLATMAAMNSGGSVEGPRGAIAEIGQQPFGKFALILIGLGLICYSIWRWVQSIKDVDGKGSDAKGIIIRIGQFISGSLYLLTAVWALDVALGWGLLSGGGSSSGDFVAQMAQHEFGVFVVWIVVIGVAFAGLYALKKAVTASFEKRWDVSTAGSWVRPVLRFGLAARSVVWFVLAYLFSKIAMSGSQQSVGVADALQEIASQDYGKWLLLATALGLVAYAFYAFLESKYRRFE